MKKVLVIFVLLLIANLVKSQASAPTIAIAEIVKHFYKNQSIAFDFHVQHSRHFNKISSLAEAPVRIKAIDNLKKKHHLDQSTILIFNETQSFLKYCSWISYYPKTTQPFYLLVYIENLRSNDLDHLAVYNEYLKGYKHVNFLIDLKGEDFIKLVTFIAFQKPHCRQFHPLTINQFSKAKKKWETQKFSIKRFQNFNGCELVIGDFGLLGIPLYNQIHEIIASSLNFTSEEWDIFCRL
jgi:hypothetical protein